MAKERWEAIIVALGQGVFGFTLWYAVLTADDFDMPGGELLIFYPIAWLLIAVFIAGMFALPFYAVMNLVYFVTGEKPID